MARLSPWLQKSADYDQDPSAHAEIIALRAAGEAFGNYRLPDWDRAVRNTGTLRDVFRRDMHARLSRIVLVLMIIRPSLRFNFESLPRRKLNHHATVVSGVLAEECAAPERFLCRAASKSQRAQVGRGQHQRRTFDSKST